MVKEDKLKALDAALGQIEKQFGKGSVMKLGDSSAHMNVETVPTGSLSLDIALGLGGIPKGRIVEVYGPESSGKTTVALHMVAEVQKRGGIAGFIDAEHALDPVYAKNIGVDVDNLYISQPDNGEQALEITETMVRSGAVDIVIVDSVAALVPRAEIDGDMGDSHVGLQARLMSQALRKLTAVISKSNCIVIFINQLREKVGVMFGHLCLALLGQPVHQELCHRHCGRDQEIAGRQFMFDLLLAFDRLLFGGKALPFVAALAVLVLIGVADTVRAAAFRDICHRFASLSSCPVEPRIEAVFRDADASACPQDTELGGAVAQVVGGARRWPASARLPLPYTPALWSQGCWSET